MARERVGATLFYAAVLLLAWFAFLVFEPFLVPLGWAVVLVVCFHPLHARLERRWGTSRAAAVSTLGVTLILILPTVLLMGVLVNEGMNALEALRELQQQKSAPVLGALERAQDWLARHVPQAADFDPTRVALEYAQRIGAFLAGRAGTVLKNVALFLFDLFVTVFAMFYLFRDRGGMLDVVRRLLPIGEPLRERMITQARDLIFASVTSGLAVAAVQGLLGGIAFAALGLKGAVFWGAVMAFLSLLPVVGAWLVWVPAAIWLFTTGHPQKAIVLAVLGAGFIGIVDNFLRPAMVSGRAQMNALLVFMSMLGGIAAFGMLGVVLGPIVVAAAISFLDAYTHAEKIGTLKSAVLE
jgi:predicted PurR-regulated permease PerM